MAVYLRDAFVTVGCAAAPVAFVPRRRIAPRLTNLRSVTAALASLRLVAALRGDRRKRRSESTGPGEPPEEPAGDDIWNDPALYMLLIH